MRGRQRKSRHRQGESSYLILLKALRPLLILFCLLMAVLPRAQASSTPLGAADFASIHAELDSCSRSHDPLSALDRFLVRQNPWSAFDPEGLWGRGESNGTVLDWIWNTGAGVVDKGAAGIRGATMGYVEVVGTGQYPINYYPDRRAEAWGQRAGRVFGLGQAAVETVAGVFGMATGSAVTATTLGTGAPVSVPLVVGSAAVTAHGANSIDNFFKLDSVREPGGGGGSAEPSAKNIRQESTEAMERGRKSEGRVLEEKGEQKNTTKHATTHGDTIPDFENAKQVGDIKDTKKVADTKQMKAQREVAEQSGREHVVVTGEKTKVTKPMENSGSRIERRPDLGPQDNP